MLLLAARYTRVYYRQKGGVRDDGLKGEEKIAGLLWSGLV